MPLIQVRRGSTAAWAAANPVLADGEPGFALPDGPFKVGNGVDPWLSLPEAEGGGLTEADADARYAPIGSASLPVAGTVLAVGSSISFGDYPIRLGVRLQEYTEMTQNVVKIAFGGRTTQGMKENLAAALETYRPSYGVIEASINDARKDLAIPSETTIANLRKMVGMCRVRGTTPVLLTSTPINYTQYNQPTQYDATSVTKQQATNALVRTLAAEMKVLLVDLYTIFEPLTNYLTDGIHLNATGNDNMGRAIAAAITGNPNPIVAPPPVTDTFTRADSDVTLGTTSDGTEAWIADVGTWGIKGNAARMAVGANGFAAVDVGRSDGTVQATLTPTGVQGIGVTLGRVDGSNNLLVGLYEGLDQVYLFKRDAGALSSLTAVALTINTATNYVVSAKLDSGVLKAWVDGVQVLNFALSTADAAKYAPGTGYGLFVSGTSGTGLADEFKVLVPS